MRLFARMSQKAKNSSERTIFVLFGWIFAALIPLCIATGWSVAMIQISLAQPSSAMSESEAEFFKKAFEKRETPTVVEEEEPKKVDWNAKAVHPLYREPEIKTVPAVRPQGYTQFSVTPNSTLNYSPQAGGQVVQGTEIIGAFADLGGTLGALGFASWLCVYLLKIHDTERLQMREAFGREREAFAKERDQHLNKDSQNDEAMREAMQRSQEQLIEIVKANQEQMSDMKAIMTQHTQDIKSVLLELKHSMAVGFDKVNEKVESTWDGEERREAGNERRASTTSSRSRTKRA